MNPNTPEHKEAWLAGAQAGTDVALQLAIKTLENLLEQMGAALPDALDGMGVERPPDKPAKWQRGQELTHVKTGRQYTVIAAPSPALRLEYCDEPFYVYRSYGEVTDHVVWHRCQSEMEDGRFVERVK